MKTGLVLLLCSLLSLLTLSCQNEKLITAPQDEGLVRAMGGGARASGRVDIDETEATGFDNIDRYSFHARSRDGVVSGRFEFRQVRFLPNETVYIRLHGETRCLRVSGNKATIGGRVTQTSHPDFFPEGSMFEWSVTDGGEGHDAADRASPLLGAATNCTFSYAEAPVRRGNVQVREGELEIDDD